MLLILLARGMHVDHLRKTNQEHAMYHDEIDADHLTSELYRMGRKSDALRRKGICSHGWSKGWKPCTCLHCGKVFDSFDDLAAERRELIS